MCQHRGKVEGQGKQQNTPRHHDDEVVGQGAAHERVSDGFEEILKPDVLHVLVTEAAPIVRGDAKGINGRIDEEKGI
jgi:hypothetical protein